MHDLERDPVFISMVIVASLIAASRLGGLW
jgi:hypothetical protein